MNESKLILGTVQFGLDYGINNKTGKPGQIEVNEILASAFDNGIRYLDTAEAYGNAHHVIGNFHKINPEKRFEVITKLPHQLDQNLENKILKYLDELQVNYLAGMLFHSYDTYKNNGHALATLNEFKVEGKIKKIGVSIYTNEQFEDVLKTELIDIVQLPFNMLDNFKLRGKSLKKAKDLGKIIHTRSCFLQGLFFTALTDSRNIVSALKKELTQLHTISKHYKIPLQKMALSYCLQQPLIDNVLIGVDNIKQFNQNLKDLDLVLPSNLLENLNDIEVKDVDLLNPSLWHQIKQF